MKVFVVMYSSEYVGEFMVDIFATEDAAETFILMQTDHRIEDLYVDAREVRE